MLNVTNKASALLDRTLEANKKSESDVLRLTQTGGNLGLALSEERANDQVIQHEGRKVLVIEPEIAQILEGATIDAVDTPAGQSLVLQPPEGR